MLHPFMHVSKTKSSWTCVEVYSLALYCKPSGHLQAVLLPINYDCVNGLTGPVYWHMHVPYGLH